MLNSNIINQSIKKRLEFFQKFDKNNLFIHEIYSSLQGESSYMGYPCVFIRTTGCHLRCSYCDTEQAFFQGQEMTVQDVLKKVESFNIDLVELTGGEPLLQKPSFLLLKNLCDKNYTVLLETSGAINISNIDKRVKVILDVKTPSSGEDKKIFLKNLEILWPGCEVKFVVSNLEDYEYAKKICTRYTLYEKTLVLISPVVSLISPQILAQKMIEDKIKARMQLQLHRVLWGEIPGR